MKRSNPVFLLFLLIILEGYVVLSTELLAIRQTIPFVGSGTDTISIIIAAVLMPLACGYYAGGQFRQRRFFSRYVTIRQKLIFNILIAMGILLAGMSYALLTAFFLVMNKAGLDNRILLTTLYSLLFLVIPVYLLGQTIPLVSNYFSKDKLSRITGKMLFFSTVGSFMGAVVSTLVLMSTIGVHYTASLNFVILAFLVLLLSKKKFSEPVLFALLIAVCAVVLNSGSVMSSLHIVENNQYNTIAVYEDGDKRYLSLNNNNSSLYSDAGEKHEYVHFIEKVILADLWTMDPPYDILVIGAGAFTLGLEDTLNNYDYVDIDKSLKDVAEEYILKQKLLPNKNFEPLPARAFLAREGKRYDVIVLDAFLGRSTLPEHLVTQEFFQQVKSRLKDSGVVVANFIVSPNFESAFSRHVDNTFRSVFPHVSRHVIKDRYLPWNTDPHTPANVVYIYVHQPEADARKIYTDDKNTAYIDKPHKR